MKLLFIRNALFTLFILIEIVIHSFYLCTFVQSCRKCHNAPLYKVIKVKRVMASLRELGPVIFCPTEDFVSWLQNKGLLASSRT